MYRLNRLSCLVSSLRRSMLCGRRGVALRCVVSSQAFKACSSSSSTTQLEANKFGPHHYILVPVLVLVSDKFNLGFEIEIVYAPYTIGVDGIFPSTKSETRFYATSIIYLCYFWWGCTVWAFQSFGWKFLWNRTNFCLGSKVSRRKHTVVLLVLASSGVAQNDTVPDDPHGQITVIFSAQISIRATIPRQAMYYFKLEPEILWK